MNITDVNEIPHAVWSRMDRFDRHLAELACSGELLPHGKEAAVLAADDHERRGNWDVGEFLRSLSAKEEPTPGLMTVEQIVAAVEALPYLERVDFHSRFCPDCHDPDNKRRCVY